MSYRKHLARAIKNAGSQSELARRSGVSQRLISFYLGDKAKNISDWAALEISRIDSTVTAAQLRPDLWSGRRRARQ